MAYVSQQMKKEVAPVIKKILAKYKMKGSLSVDNHSTLVLTLRSGALDIIGNYMETNANKPEHRLNGRAAPDYMSVNTYWVKDHYTGKVKAFLEECVAALKSDKYFDKSDIQTDYFHCSHYIEINVGKWNKAYELTGKASAPAKPVIKFTPSTKIRIFANGVGLYTTVKQVNDGLFASGNVRRAVEWAMGEMETLQCAGFAARHDGLDIQVDIM